MVGLGEGYAATPPDGHQLEDAFALTPRKREVLGGLMAGETYSQIAARLFISEKTLSSHVSNILRKTGTASRIELTAMTRAGHAPVRRDHRGASSCGRR